MTPAKTSLPCVKAPGSTSMAAKATAKATPKGRARPNFFVGLSSMFIGLMTAAVPEGAASLSLSEPLGGLTLHDTFDICRIEALGTFLKGSRACRMEARGFGCSIDENEDMVDECAADAIGGNLDGS
mgnify:CR=1 FL=1